MLGVGRQGVGGRVAHVRLEAVLAQQLPHQIGDGRLVVAHAHALRVNHPASFRPPKPFPAMVAGRRPPRPRRAPQLRNS